MHEIPAGALQFLSNPSVADSSFQDVDSVCELIVELLHSAGVNETNSNSISKLRDMNAGMGLARSLRWVYQSNEVLGESLNHRMTLKSLMPMYLAAGQGRIGSGWAETISLVRSSCALLELSRLTTSQELSEWLRANNSKGDPHHSILKTFRISITKLADVFWDELSGGKAKFLNKVSTEKQHAAWWSLACQFSERHAQITVPAELAAGFIAWDKLLNHWQRMVQALSGKSTSSSSETTNTPSDHALASDLNQIKPTLNDRRFVEIRSSKDPQLSANMEQLLMNARNDQGLLSLIVVKRLCNDTRTRSSGSESLQNWQSKFIKLMDTRGESANVRGFISDEGELSLVFQDVDRSELAQWIRESFAKFGQNQEDSKLATAVVVPLIAGVATVNAPSRSFKIEQLIQSAWRCLDGASTQGAGAVKTIEVY